jgi:hypothetical protein
MHSHSLRGGKKHSCPKKHKSAEEEEEEEEEEEKEDGLSENQNSSQTGFFCLPQQQKAAPPKIQNCSDPCKILAKEKFDLKNRAQTATHPEEQLPSFYDPHTRENRRLGNGISSSSSCSSQSLNIRALADPVGSNLCSAFLHMWWLSIFAQDVEAGKSQ